MRTDLQTITATFAATVLAATLGVSMFQSGIAAAQAPLLDDDDDDMDAGDDAPSAPEVVEDPNAPHMGIGLRLRQTFLPKGIVEAFVERAEGGFSNFGIGIEGIRRRGNLEISLGIEYESLAGNTGIWIDNDGAADLVEYDGFGWLTFDFTFVWHTKLHDFVSLRYGGGAGLGVIFGDVLQTDFVCTGGGVGNCVQDPVAQDIRAPQGDVPPVFPVINMLLGLQIKPTDKIAINIEGGMRTVFYFGTTVAYFF